jgi:hypothetical protein
MKLITEHTEDVQYLEEKVGDKKNLYIKGVFLQAEQKNRNGRVYPLPILEREVKRYNDKYIDQNRAFGELGHPQGPTVNLDRVSHMITELEADGNNFVGKAKIMDTPMGKIVSSIMNEDAQLGVSSRGMGSLKEKNGINEVQDDYYLATAADIVADPSAPNCFVQGIMEGKEWAWDNGVLKESDVARIKRKLDEASSKRDREEEILRSFAKLMSEY